jgi:2-polyprenyl-3-methyl-5-hydroxy-6-metoxy-1,4-benzoquinol methylase
MRNDERRPDGILRMKLNTIVELNRGQKVSEDDTFTRSRYLHFMNHFDVDTRDVLDLGCNTGRGGAVMKARKAHLRIMGLDCVPERIASLDRQTYDAGVCSFSREIPLPSNSFDAIVAGEFIEHVQPEDVFPSLCECWRLLRLRGRLLLTTPNPQYIKNRISGLSVLTEPSHVSQHTPASMRRRLEDIGFSQIRVFGTGRVSSLIGRYFPILSAYGSYLIVGKKW